ARCWWRSVSVLVPSPRSGLKRISTNIVQLPSKDNGMYAVVEAEVETDDGVFRELGDASPENVSRSIQPHLLRMASTRAKARAMRDAVGIDMVALEELGETPSEEEGNGLVEERGPDEVVITFGKYANRTLGEILAVDRGYVEWLSQNARDQAVRAAASAVIEPAGFDTP
ncbi:MAG: hypothetical protein NUW23_15560, partial [Firmicutes bacterium]|nr:hypothetical protein [Bacillota bacterium]